MKIFKFIGLAILLSWGCYSCNDDDSKGIPIHSKIVMQGEGDATEITFATGDWRIKSILNTSKEYEGTQPSTISGKIFDNEGKLISENTPLALDDLGILEANWGYKGFKINRSTDNSLRVETYENASDEEFGYTIIIEYPNKTKAIVVEQQASGGYTFKHIEFFVSEEDGDKLYYKKGTSMDFDLTEQTNVTINPFNGINLVETSYFKSDDSYAFIWFKDGQLKVNVPELININNGEVLTYSKDQYIYGEVTQKNTNRDVKHKINIPAGKSSYHTELQWRERQVSYHLIMLSKSTSLTKTIEGKWIERALTGEYKIVRDL